MMRYKNEIKVKVHKTMTFMQIISSKIHETNPFRYEIIIYKHDLAYKILFVETVFVYFSQRKVISQYDKSFQFWQLLLSFVLHSNI